MASPLLWQHLRLTPYITRANGSVYQTSSGAMRTKQKGGKVLRNDVNIFTLHYHSADWCNSESKSTLQLPNIHTLHLHLGWKSRIHTHASYGGPGCRLLRSIKPKTIVIHNSGILWNNFSQSLPEEIHDEVEVLSYIFPAYDISSPYLLLEPVNALPKLQKFYIFVNPDPYTEQKEANEGDRFIRLSSCLSNLASTSRFYKNTKITFINLDAMDHFLWPDDKLTSETVQSHLPSKFENAPENKDRYRFISLEQFMEEEEWWNYIEEKQMVEWLRVMKNPPTKADLEGDWRYTVRCLKPKT